MNNNPHDRRPPAPVYDVVVEQSQPDRFRAFLRDNPDIATRSNFKLLDQRMRLAVGVVLHGGDSWCFDLRYQTEGNPGAVMVTRVDPADRLTTDSTALVLSLHPAERAQQMAGWVRARNAEDPWGRHLGSIIEDHDGGAKGVCSVCRLAAPCPTSLSLVMHYITLLGAEIVRPG